MVVFWFWSHQCPHYVCAFCSSMCFAKIIKNHAYHLLWFWVGFWFIFPSWSIPGCINCDGKPDGVEQTAECTKITPSHVTFWSITVFSFKYLSCMYNTRNPWIKILISLQVTQDHFPRNRIPP